MGKSNKDNELLNSLSKRKTVDSFNHLLEIVDKYKQLLDKMKEMDKFEKKLLQEDVTQL